MDEGPQLYTMKDGFWYIVTGSSIMHLGHVCGETLNTVNHSERPCSKCGARTTEGQKFLIRSILLEHSDLKMWKEEQYYTDSLYLYPDIEVFEI